MELLSNLDEADLPVIGPKPVQVYRCRLTLGP